MTPWTEWMRLDNEEEVPSPALVIHLDRVERNLAQMLAISGGPARLRPHVKTHKLPQIVAMQVAMGITKCKCATVAEAEMAAGAGALDILLAMQPVGPAIGRLLHLIRAFPDAHFSVIVDSSLVASELNEAALEAGIRIEVLLDLDVGMGRSGILRGEDAALLYAEMTEMPGLHVGGIHAYDGHLQQTDVGDRTEACDRSFEAVDWLRGQLVAAGLSVPKVVAGGSPTFPMHARREGVECGPGTTVLWDAGYARKMPDLEFLPAATLLARVVSRPGVARLCLDLGHKAVASEMPHPRVVFPDLPDARAVMHSEEHLVVETSRASKFPVGTIVHGIPWHICPTVALHSEVYVCRRGRASETWPVVARARRLTI
jgi:D-serine deaminase-like pyridoxal phosphate-dependent protein